MIKKIFVALSIVFIFSINSSVHAKDSATKGVKLGFGYDRGLGVTGLYGKFNGFIGNDGIAVDYLFFRQKLNVDVDAAMHWHFGAGGYIDWEDDLGVRAPVGAEIQFSKNLDAYAQVIPRLRLNDSVKFGLGGAIAVRYIFD